jgi:hypothetical protein
MGLKNKIKQESTKRIMEEIEGEAHRRSRKKNPIMGT